MAHSDSKQIVMRAAVVRRIGTLVKMDAVNVQQMRIARVHRLVMHLGIV